MTEDGRYEEQKPSVLKKRTRSEKRGKSRNGRRRLGNQRRKSRIAEPTKRKDNKAGKERHEASDLGRNPGKIAQKGQGETPPTLNVVDF